MDLSIIIPTHNRVDALEQTLAALARQEFAQPWEVIVVDNNSTDETNEVVGRMAKDFPVDLILTEETKPGPAAARNKGASIARGEYLLFMDNDIIAAPDLLSRHYRRLTENPGCWIVGQFPNKPDQEATIFGRYQRHLYPLARAKSLVETNAITGAGTSMPREDFEQLGGFDMNFFAASGEDRELAMRAIASGIRILYDPSIVAIHNDWAGTSIRDYCRRQRIYTQTEPIFAAKYGDKNPRAEMARKNSPLTVREDGLKLTLSKLGKWGAGSRIGQALLIGLCEVLERVIPDTRLLWSCYRTAIAGAIYKGYQEGLERLRNG
jgi:GT2 family glycosyltransferase